MTVSMTAVTTDMEDPMNTATARTEQPAFTTPAQRLKQHTAAIRLEAAEAYHNLAARMEALAAEAADLATVENVFPPKALEGLRQFTNNTRSSISIITSAMPAEKA